MLIKRRDEAPEVDMSPMIDVVFQLIIFFMVVLSLAAVFGIIIKFPQQAASQQKNQSQEKILTVFIYQDWIEPGGPTGHNVIQDGDIKLVDETVQLWISGDPKTRDQDREVAFKYIRDKMKWLIDEKGFKKDMLVIKGDVKTYHWKVVKIIDNAKSLGITGYSLAPPFN
jgi:biopolymer transport protein ExbD